MRYTATDSFETLPYPDTTEALHSVGLKYAELRSALMRESAVGLTKLYNRFHSNTERDPRIEGLRALQREMDIAVARAYGWDDLDLEHGFHEVPYLPENDRVRFTISERARLEVLRRLSELNRQRYEEEVARGLHGSKATESATRKPRTRRTETTSVRQSSFGFDIAPANEGRHLKAAEPSAGYRAGPAHAIVEYLKTHPGWRGKSDILAATRITDGQWNTAIAELLADGRVERQGERRGARYRAKD